MATRYMYGNETYRFKRVNDKDYNRQKAKRKAQKIKTKKNIRNLTILVAFFILIATMVILYGKLMEANYSLSSTKDNYESMVNKNTEIESEIEQKLDLDEVYQFAVNELGMKEPMKHQIYFLNINEADKTLRCNYSEVKVDEVLLNIFN